MLLRQISRKGSMATNNGVHTFAFDGKDQGKTQTVRVNKAVRSVYTEPRRKRCVSATISEEQFGLGWNRRLIWKVSVDADTRCKRILSDTVYNELIVVTGTECTEK